MILCRIIDKKVFENGKGNSMILTDKQRIVAVFVLGLFQFLFSATYKTTVNQQINGNMWYEIGTFLFLAESGGNLLLKNDGTNGYVVADAVMFKKGDVEVLLDNSDSSGVSIMGDWVESSSTIGYYGTNYLHDANILKGEKSIRYTPVLLEDGEYQVFLRWTATSNRATNVPVEIAYNIDTSQHKLIVVNGSGSGNYYFGEEITLIADTPPLHHQFYMWSSDNGYYFSNIRNDTTIFTMTDKEVSVTAVYCDSADLPSRLIRNLDSGLTQTIVTYGTSLTEYGAWVDRLRDSLYLRYSNLATVINSGGSGMWSEWGVDNLQSKVLNYNPDAVFIEFSMNDAVDRFDCSTELSRSNLEDMINRILKQNPFCEIILQTMNAAPLSSSRPNLEDYYQVYRDVASEEKHILIDHYPNWINLYETNAALFNAYIPDGVHPNATGHSDITMPEISKVLFNNAETTLNSEYHHSPFFLSVAPNPFTNRIVIDFRGEKEDSRKKADIRVYRISGKLVGFIPSLLLPFNITWNPNNEPSGIYIVKIK